RVAASRAEPARDVAAVEEPLEIRLAGTPFVVIMRTPGADRELAAGFLFGERIIAGADDLGVIRHCIDPDGGQAPNVVTVQLAEGVASGLEAVVAGRRAATTTSACGVCGRRTIDDLMRGVEPVRASWRLSAGIVHTLPAVLRSAQVAFAETGGLHAAGLFDREGRLLASAEDVGRHNAVDKVIGAQVLMERLPLDERVLVVSGRAGYEIVQKALVARIPVVASVSAPSSLAIDLARDGGLTLLGFVRDGSFNIYTGAERIDA
ncbi:MAG: formate dehydrogenase accessory sulfurtransferase FdhD, partial [Myxococcota bacterium]